MSGGKGAKQQVTLYYMSLHFGICSSVDAIRRIIIKEKEAWKGLVSSLSLIQIDKTELFGGEKKEGGAKGTVCFLPGAADQVLPDELAQKLGRANGADCPGYRGLASAFFYGSGTNPGGDGLLGLIFRVKQGFYWTANNPYLPGVWIEVRRAPVGLTAEYAMVPRSDTNFFPSDSVAAPSGMPGKQISPDGATLYSIAGTGFQAWDLSTRTLVASTSLAVGIAVGGVYAITPDGIYGVADTDVVLISPDGSSAAVVGTGGHWNAAWYAGGQVVLTPNGFTGDYFGTPGTPNGEYVTDYLPTCVFEATDGTAMAVGTTASAHAFAIGPTFAMADAVIDTTAYGSSGTPFAFDSGASYVVLQGTHLFRIDKGSYAVLGHVSGVSAPINSGAVFSSFKPGAQTFWLELVEYNALDLSVIRTISPLSWTITGGEIEDYLYDPTNRAILTSNTFADPWLHFRYLDRGEVDANPAHVIYECLTNTDWGMGSPAELVDTTSFEAAGVTLFNEPLGLSLIWTKQAAIQDFIQEILDHIHGALFVDPQTGLLTLKLIRGDYDVSTLPTISPSTAKLTNFARKLWGEIVNEITVTWTNPDNEQDETVTVHDLASITTQGGIVPDSRNYYGVRYADLAVRLAGRDLRSAGAPLATFEAEVDRSLWYVRPASVLLVDWPEHGLDGVVARVTSVDYGKPGDPTIKLNLIEDVFGLDAADYVAPPSTSWSDPSQLPTAPDAATALTLPYFFASNSTVSIDGATYPEVLAGVLAASSNPDTFGAELWGQVVGTDGTTSWVQLASINLAGRAVLDADLPAASTSSGVSFSSFIGDARPGRGGIALIGAGSEAETELALITAASTTYGLARGMLDTVPQSWAAGTPVWFLSEDMLWEDPDARSSGEVVSYKVRTRTSQGLLALSSAPNVTATLTDRPWEPLRPANVQVDGVLFNDSATPVDASLRTDPWVTITWANRNRLTEDSRLLKWTDATVTPETGQTTTVSVYGSDGLTLLASHTGLTGTSYDVLDADFGTQDKVLIRAAASRTDGDGTFDSLQAHGIWVKVKNVASGSDVAGAVGTASFASAVVMGGTLSAAGAASSGEIGDSTVISWSNAFATTGGGPDGGWSPYTARNIMPAAQLADLVGKTQMRLVFRISELGPSLAIQGVYVGLKGVGAFDFASTPTQVFFGGSAGCDINNPSSSPVEVVTDAFAWSYDGSAPLVISIDFATPAGGHINSLYADTTISGLTCGYKTGDYGADLVFPSSPFTSAECLVTRIEVA